MTVCISTPYPDASLGSIALSQLSTSPVPMSKWNKDALISLERDLKINVNPDEMIDLLEVPAGGFMTEGERMSVCEQPNRREKVGRIITLLRGKGDRDFDIFMKLLRKSGNEVWAGQLEEKVWLIKTDPQGGGRSTSLNKWNVCTMFAHTVWELSVGDVRYAGTTAIK